jgi:hypothetical protein
MELRKLVQMKPGDLIVPGDFAKTLNNAHVDALTESIRERGQITPVIAQRDGKRCHLVFGRHRLAACLRLKRRIWVLLADSRAEAVDFAAEQLRRQRTIEELRALTTQLIRNAENQPEQKPAVRRSGRRKSPERQAIREAARIAGVSEDTVERAVGSQRAPKVGAVEAEAEPPVDDRGIEIPEDRVDDWNELRGLFETFDRSYQNIQAQITRVKKNARPDGDVARYLALAHLQRLEELAHELAAAARAVAPWALCPFCKLLPTLRANCNGCGGSGFAPHSWHNGAVPKELLATGTDAGVLLQGARFKRLSDLTERSEVHRW